MYFEGNVGLLSLMSSTFIRIVTIVAGSAVNITMIVPLGAIVSLSSGAFVRISPVWRSTVTYWL